MLKRLSHTALVAIGRPLAKLLPDRIPVTFVGTDSVSEMCNAIAHTGVGKILVVTDAVLVDLGIAGRVVDCLEAAGVDHSLYSAVEPDPTFAQVESGHAHFAKDKCQAVLALGGGSPMDAAKMIAAMATNGGPLSKLEGKFRLRKPPAPLFAVPTTAGTGSEVTIAAVVSDSDTHAKKFFLDPKLLPTMAALDPSLMTGVPPKITAATGMDALTHAVESFISKTATPQSESYAMIGVRSVFENLAKSFTDGTDLSARTGMALASYYAGLAFTRTSVGYVHAIAHTLGALYGTPHGLANAIVLPHVLEFSKQAARPRLARLAEVIHLNGNDDSEKADKFIDAVRGLLAKIEIPSKLDSLKRGDIDEIATRALNEAYLDYPVPRFMNHEECTRLIGQLLPE